MVFSEDILKRFWSKVDIKGPDECWNWKAGKNALGYGSFSTKKINGRMMGAHRVSLIIKTHINPKDLYCLHSCDNPSCVNPHHLRWGTISENSKDTWLRNHKYTKECRERFSILGKRTIHIANQKRRIFSDTEELEIYSSHLSGESSRFLSKRFNCDKGTILNAVKRQKIALQLRKA